MKSFLQTEEWLEFQKEAGHKVWRFDPASGEGKIKANIIKYNLPFGKSYLYIPHGPEINFEVIRTGIKNELVSFVKYLRELARAENSVFVKIEPSGDVIMELLHVKGMRRSSKQIQPYKTVVLDLSLPEEHLLGKMHTKTRYNIKVAEKHGIKIEISDNVAVFWDLLRKTAKRDKFSSHPEEYYKKLISFLGESGGIKTEIFMAKNSGGKAVAGAIILRYGDTGYYLHGASDYEFRSMMAPYALHWEIIKKLKDSGYRFYDFWGIDAQKWPGVTRFKLGWGGDTKELPGSFDLVISGLWYMAYNLARKIM